MTTYNNDPKQAKKSLIIGIIGILIFGLMYGYYTFVEPNQIKADSSTTTAKITMLGDNAMRGTTTPTIFEYQVNGKKYEGNFDTFLPCLKDQFSATELAKHAYTVVYSNKNPEIARLLISPKMFEEYDMAIDEKSKEMYEKFWNCD